MYVKSTTPEVFTPEFAKESPVFEGDCDLIRIGTPAKTAGINSRTKARWIVISEYLKSRSIGLLRQASPANVLMLPITRLD
jgi:hypothetical protein